MLCTYVSGVTKMHLGLSHDPPLVWTQVRFFSQCTKSVMLLVHTVLVLEHYSKDFFHALWQETEIEIKHFKANNDKIMNELVPGIEPRSPAWEVSMLTITPRRSYINICLICRTISGKCKIDMIHWKKMLHDPVLVHIFDPFFEKWKYLHKFSICKDYDPPYCVTKCI